jgi:hypothetical protein
MKHYKIGQKVLFISSEFDSTFTTAARIVETFNDHAIAEEITAGRPMRLYIDDDTDFMFKIV